MRVGLFIDTFYPMVDGVINVVDNYARELSKYCEVTVFCPLVDKTEITDKPYRIVQCTSLSIKGLDYSLPLPKVDSKFSEALSGSNLDIVHIHSPFTVGEAGVAYAKKHGVPLVATLHSQYRQDFERTIKLKIPVDIAMSAIMRVFNSCDECWAVNGAIKELYQKEYGLTSPCKVMPNATDHLPIENEEVALKSVNEKFNLLPDETVYLFIGRITFLKNVQLILSALKLLKNDGKKFKMLFVGSGQDEEELKKQIDSLGLSDDIILTGKISDKEMLKSLYLRAKLFLFPSLYDANSLVQIEAACQKTPTVFVKGAKTASLVTDGENGFIAENSAEGLARKIAEIESSPVLYKRVCEGAKRDLYTSWSEVVKSVFLDYVSHSVRKKSTQ